jgi:hypothetical protein
MSTPEPADHPAHPLSSWADPNLPPIPQGAPGAIESPAWRTPGPHEVVAVPGVVRILDAGVPWLRSLEELDYDWTKIKTHILAIVNNGLPNDYDSLDGVERGLFGVYNAARWTLGVTTKAPASGRLIPVTGGSLRRELALAESRLIARSEGWEHATGVVTWIGWITGASLDLVLPTDPPRTQ